MSVHIDFYVSSIHPDGTEAVFKKEAVLDALPRGGETVVFGSGDDEEALHVESAVHVVDRNAVEVLVVEPHAHPDDYNDLNVALTKLGFTRMPAEWE